MWTTDRAGIGTSICRHAPDDEISSSSAVKVRSHPDLSFHSTSTMSAHNNRPSKRLSGICLSIGITASQVYVEYSVSRAREGNIVGAMFRFTMLAAILASSLNAQPAPPLGERAAVYLTDLLRIDTSNPPGGETRVAEYLKKVAEAQGIAC